MLEKIFGPYRDYSLFVLRLFVGAVFIAHGALKLFGGLKVLLHCEQGFKRVKGYAAIKQVVAAIEAEQAEGRKLRSAA